MDRVAAMHRIGPGLIVELEEPAGPLPPALETRVAACWEDAQRRTGGRLFNGTVVSVTAVTPGRIGGRLVEYRQAVAAYADPALCAALAVRPLAACGVIRTRDGILFGRRTAAATYEAGLWQTPPAGSVDAGAVHGMQVDAEGQLRTELLEEVGLAGAAVQRCEPFGLVVHAGVGVHDLGYLIETDLGLAEIAALHRACGSPEYVELRAVPESGLAAFLADARPGLAAAARPFLALLGLVSTS